MDESCGYVEQVDDNEVMVPGSGRRVRGLSTSQHRIPFLDRSWSGSSRTLHVHNASTVIQAAKKKSLLDDSDDGYATAGHVAISTVAAVAAAGGGTVPLTGGFGQGDLDDELGYIQAQLNNSNGGGLSPSEREIPSSLSGTSSFDSGRFDWDVACKL
jgi:hypothetical protein